MDESVQQKKNDEAMVHDTLPVSVVLPPKTPSAESYVVVDGVVTLVSENDSVANSPVRVPEASIVPMPGGEIVQMGDVWTNEESTFRVDTLEPTGSVNIRFRVAAHADSRRFSAQKIVDFFKKKSVVPMGEWFFGSIDEFKRFVDEKGYRLEKRLTKSETTNQKVGV